jgi:hypothetical protein
LGEQHSQVEGEQAQDQVSDPLPQADEKLSGEEVPMEVGRQGAKGGEASQKTDADRWVDPYPPLWGTLHAS